MNRLFASVSLCISALLLLCHSSWAEPLEVHIIAHSHCDPGWLETFEGYYNSKVKAILTNTYNELKNNPERRFTWSETSYFHRWWREQSDEIKKDYKRLVKTGQIEFINSGWVQEDEANPDPTSTVNQLMVGHQYMLAELGVRPKIAWQIDPFGHSATFASLAAMAGFEALVINRIPFDVKANFKNSKHMEFIWKGSDVGLGDNTDMFTHVLHTHYSAPHGFDWENGNQRVTAQNVKQRARDFANQMKSRSQAYRHNLLLVPFGDDFKFHNAALQFSNMDQIIAEINSHSSEYDMKVLYSTPGAYFKAVNAKKNVEYPVHRGDFFPYADNADSYWTGYYTTRPAMKTISRRLQAQIRGAEILHAIQLPQHKEQSFADLQDARMQQGLFMHHDAITGTCKKHVMDDYMSRMTRVMAKMKEVTARLVQNAITDPTKPAVPPLVFSSTLLPNPSKRYRVVVYNSLAWARKEIVSVTVGAPHVTVSDHRGLPVVAQVDPFWEANAPDPAADKFTLHFVAETPPLGISTYFVAVTSAPAPGNAATATVTVFGESKSSTLRGGTSLPGGASVFKVVKKPLSELNNAPALESGLIAVKISSSNGLIEEILDKQTQKKTPVGQALFQYNTQRSGAYLFRPQGDAVELNADGLFVRTYTGPVLQTSLNQHKTNECYIKVAGGSDPELASFVSEQLEVSVGSNQELVLRVRSDTGELRTHDGLEWRVRDVNKINKNNKAANFYPMTNGARLSDGTKQLTFINEHTMSVGQQSAGELEIMLHRALARDDGRGLGEGVLDGSRASIHLLVAAGAHTDPTSEAELPTRQLITRHNNPYTVLTASAADVSMTSISPARRRLLGVDVAQWTTLFSQHMKKLPSDRANACAAFLSKIEAELSDLPEFSTHEALQAAGADKWRLRKDIIDFAKAYKSATSAPGAPPAASPVAAAPSTTPAAVPGLYVPEPVPGLFVPDTDPALPADPMPASEPNTPGLASALPQPMNQQSNPPPAAPPMPETPAAVALPPGELDLGWIAPLGPNGFPPDVHLMSLLALGENTDEVVMRLQSLGPKTDLDGDISVMFAADQPLVPSHLRETTLTVNADISLANYFKGRMKFTPGTADVHALMDQSIHPDANQNTQEEGVFISDAALEAAKGGRRLLAMPSDSFATEREWDRHLAEHWPTPPSYQHSRQLLQSGDVSAGNTRFVFSAWQVRSFKFCLNAEAGGDKFAFKPPAGAVASSAVPSGVSSMQAPSQNWAHYNTPKAVDYSVSASAFVHQPSSHDYAEIGLFRKAQFTRSAVYKAYMAMMGVITTGTLAYFAKRIGAGRVCGGGPSGKSGKD